MCARHIYGKNLTGKRKNRTIGNESGKKASHCARHCGCQISESIEYRFMNIGVREMIMEKERLKVIMRRLTRLKQDEISDIETITGDSRFISRIASIGLSVGSTVRVMRNGFGIDFFWNQCHLGRHVVVTGHFNVPCFATVAIIRSETLSTWFTLLVAGYYFLAALVIAGIAYRIGLMIF
jgi:hypothetical protein